MDTLVHSPKLISEADFFGHTEMSNRQIQLLVNYAPDAALARLYDYEFVFWDDGRLLKNCIPILVNLLCPNRCVAVICHQHFHIEHGIGRRRAQIVILLNRNHA